MKLRFWIRKKCHQYTGSGPLYCYITLNGERSKDFSARIVIDLQKWNAKKQIINDNDYASNQLAKVKNDLFKIEAYYIEKDQPFSVNDIKDTFIKYRGVPTEKIKLISFFKKFLSYQTYLSQPGIKTKPTVTSMRVRFHKLKNFLKHRKTEDILLKEVNIKFANRFYKWILIEEQLTNNYAMKNIRILKQVLDYAISEEKLQHNPLQTFKFRFDKPKSISYLYPNELKALEKHKFAQTRLQQVADLFVFECYTGLAYSDAMHFNYNLNIRKGPDKRHWIELHRQKSDQITLLPLIRKA